MTDLRDDERAWIDAAPDRCTRCGHLWIFHNEHCCAFCMVPGDDIDERCGCQSRFKPFDEDD